MKCNFKIVYIFILFAFLLSSCSKTFNGRPQIKDFEKGLAEARKINSSHSYKDFKGRIIMFNSITKSSNFNDPQVKKYRDIAEYEDFLQKKMKKFQSKKNRFALISLKRSMKQMCDIFRKKRGDCERSPNHLILKKLIKEKIEEEKREIVAKAEGLKQVEIKRLEDVRKTQALKSAHEKYILSGAIPVKTLNDAKVLLNPSNDTKYQFTPDHDPKSKKLNFVWKCKLIRKVKKFHICWNSKKMRVGYQTSVFAFKWTKKFISLPTNKWYTVVGKYTANTTLQLLTGETRKIPVLSEVHIFER
jgi:PBP1b-binding outer membrane lipoprotein LpoB